MSLDLSSYKVSASETSSATKFNNMVQAVQDFVNALPIANLASYPADATKYLRGDGTWAIAPSAHVTKAALQTIANNTNVAIQFDTERWDTDNIHDNVTNNTRLTCKTAGKYLAVANVGVAANAAGQRQLQITSGGVTTVAVSSSPVNSASSPWYGTVAAVVDLAVNDYLELYLFQDSGGNLDVLKGGNYTPEFSIVRVA